VVWRRGADLPLFYGDIDLHETHKKMESMAGCCVWMDYFVPVNSPQKRLIKYLLRNLHSEGVCCTIQRLFPAHQAGRLKQILFAGLYIAICGTPQTESVRLLLEHSANYRYFTARESNFTLLSPYLLRGYGFEDRDKGIRILFSPSLSIIVMSVVADQI
jgi:hypothetical protein